MHISSFVSAASAVALASLVAAERDAEKKPSDIPEPLILVEFFAPWYVVLRVYASVMG